MSSRNLTRWVSEFKKLNQVSEFKKLSQVSEWVSLRNLTRRVSSRNLTRWVNESRNWIRGGELVHQPFNLQEILTTGVQWWFDKQKGKLPDENRLILFHTHRHGWVPDFTQPGNIHTDTVECQILLNQVSSQCSQCLWDYTIILWNS